MIRWFAISGVVGVLLWLGGFVLFVETLPATRLAEGTKTEAIIVLTGGPGRVEQGLKALAAGDSPVLFISGVGRKVTLQEMVGAHASAEVQANIRKQRAHIILDYLASSTQSNASEAASFVAKYHIRSVRLVTAYFHMPRSLVEFHAAMPGVTLVPDPVLPMGFRPEDWWQEDATRKLLLGEYHKYLGAMVLRLLA